MSLITAVIRDLEPPGAMDLHAYWYPGHFVRQGEDPYRAYVISAVPDVPTRYLDGPVVTSLPIAQPGLATAPANTAPLVLLLHVLSYLSWQTAKTVWLVVNVALVLVIPWLAFRLVPRTLSVQSKLVLALIFYGLAGTRTAVILGQPALIVFFLMICTILLAYRNSRVLAGLAFGIALSKYSLAFPVLLWLLYRRRFAIVAGAALVQIVGVLIIAAYSHGRPLVTLSAYVDLFVYHFQSRGFELRNMLPDDWLVSLVILTALTGITFFSLWVGIRHARASRQSERLIDLWILSVLSMWSLLIAYHRVPDTVLLLFPLLFFVSLPLAAQPPTLRAPLVMGAGGLMAISIPIVSLPGLIFARPILMRPDSECCHITLVVLIWLGLMLVVGLLGLTRLVIEVERER